jgi:hypothetical protein
MPLEFHQVAALVLQPQLEHKLQALAVVVLFAVVAVQ